VWLTDDRRLESALGSDASCTLTIDGKALRGTAQLETRDLVFRGPLRLVIPLAAISRAVASGSTLEVTFGDRRASFDIGPQAGRWARRITNPPSRLDKLGVKPGMSVAVVALRDERFLAELAERGAVVSRRVPAKSARAQVVFFGATRTAALDKLATLSGVIQPDGAIWVVRPKGDPRISERDTMAAGARAGLVDVKVVSFSDTHTAEKFVIPVARRAAAAGPPGRARKTARTRR
jgi:hypothetical protein